MVGFEDGLCALCGIQEDGYVWCGELSTVDRPVAHPPPIPLHSLTGADWTACGLDDGAHIVCWGDNGGGQRDPP